MAVLGAATLSGCYAYVPVARPAVGAPVRVKVPVRSTVGASDGQSEMVSFEGTVVSFGDTLLLGTRTSQVVGAHRDFVIADTIRVATDQLEDLEERVLSKGRSAALTAGIVAGGILLATVIDGWAGGDEGDRPGDTPNPETSRISNRPRGWRLFGFRIPVPWPSG